MLFGIGQKARRTRRILSLSLATTLGGLLTWLAFRSIEWGQVLRAMEHIQWHVLVLAFMAVTLATLLQAYRWKLLLPWENVSVSRLFLVKNAGQSLNNISPVRIVADLTQAAMLIHGDGIRAPKAVSSIIMARMFDTLITVNIVGAGLILMPQLAHFKSVVAPLWGLTTGFLVAFLLFGKHMDRIPLILRIKFLRETVHSMSMVRTRFNIMLACIALTALAWTSVGAAAWLISRATGVPLPFWVVSVIIIGVGIFAGAMPGPPGMMGIYEFVAVSTLGLFNVNGSIALSFALVIHGVLFLPPLLIGLPTLMLEKRRKPASAPPATREEAPEALPAWQVPVPVTPQ